MNAFHVVMGGALGAVLALGGLSGCAPTATSSTNQRDNAMSDRAMYQAIADQPTYEAVVNRFIERARAGDVEGMAALLSEGEKRHTGLTQIDDFSRQQIVPFFKARPTHQTITIAGATDSFGNQGYTFYGFAADANGKKAPYAIYVVKENGKLVVGSATVNQYVKGRHGN